MSTKYILDSAREPITKIITTALNSLMVAQLAANHPELLLDTEELKSRTTVLVAPAVASIVEELAGNAEGATKVLATELISQMRRHMKESAARAADTEIDEIGELLEAIFTPLATGAKPRDEVAEARKNRGERASPANREAVQERLSDIFDQIDPRNFRGGRAS